MAVTSTIITFFVCHVFLYLAVFCAIFLGCLTNCFPTAFPFLFAFVVAAYSLEDKAFIAFSGKYLSPVFPDGLPDLVLHFCFVHFDSLLVVFFLPEYVPPESL